MDHRRHAMNEIFFPALTTLTAFAALATAACPGPRAPATIPPRGDNPTLSASFKTPPLPPPTTRPAPRPTTLPWSTPARSKMPTLPTGSLTRAEILRVIHKNSRGIRYCYERTLSNTPHLQGRVIVDIVVAPDGSVRRVSVGDTTLKSPPVEACIVSSINKWIFPKPHGGILFITYPFNFRGSAKINDSTR